jgi:hypothetical protein
MEAEKPRLDNVPKVLQLNIFFVLSAHCSSRSGKTKRNHFLLLFSLTIHYSPLTIHYPLLFFGLADSEFTRRAD